MENRSIQSRIYEIRGQKVMLDFDLALLYNSETRTLKQAVRRNLDRFPSDFMFELTVEEFESLRSQIVMSKPGRGGTRHKPFAAAIHFLLQKDQLETVQRERKRIGFKTENKK